MLRTHVIEQLPGMALMEVRTKLQTPDVVSRTEVQHKLITLCWGCHQTVCNACCASLCMYCPLFGGKHTAFLQRSWALQMAELPVDKPRTTAQAAPKCPTCHRIVCVLCDLGMCPGCLKLPARTVPDPIDPPYDCGACSRRLCPGCGRCECRRCQPELCRTCMRVRGHRCPVACDGSALTLRSQQLPRLPGSDRGHAAASQTAAEAHLASLLVATKNPHDASGSVRCPACDRRCPLELVLRVFCCRNRWRPLTGCTHAVGGATAAESDTRRLDLATCGSDDNSCDSEESSEPAGFAELVPPHCRIFTGDCRGGTDF